jgi:hypothetical protein
MANKYKLDLVIVGTYNSRGDFDSIRRLVATRAYCPGLVEHPRTNRWEAPLSIHEMTLKRSDLIHGA